MNKTVKLYNTVGRLSDREPFVLQDGENFTLDLDCDVVINDCIAVFKKDGKEAKMHYQRADLKQITIPQDFVSIGTVEVEIDILSHGIVVRCHYVEPITFVATDEGFKGHLEYERLLEEVADLKETVRVQAELIGALSQRLTLTETQVREIWEYEEQ